MLTSATKKSNNNKDLKGSLHSQQKNLFQEMAPSSDRFSEGAFSKQCELNVFEQTALVSHDLIQLK